ncbi:MAG: prepilin-type N-terminal cleavage/methylation domain-containing protein [Candidatus Daviesbacteria bacterium]|nr:prepilin-type N-terminal cleavage/methylation domain-containing protein [Candidatus Daviesbacteria bacterium]
MKVSSGFTLIRTCFASRYEKLYHSLAEPCKGFTLIELLIAVSIIALLMTIGAISYMGFLRTTRDTSRQTDLKTIQSVLEQYHADLHFYPTAQFTFAGQRFTNASGRAGNPQVTKTYLNNTPKEQWTQTAPYLYVPLPAGCGEVAPLCSNYCLYARLEGTSPGLGSCATQTVYNYAVSQP